MASCFPYFTVRALETFCVKTVERERSTPNRPKAAPMGGPTPLANAGIEVPPAIAGDVIKLVSTIPMILLNHFFFWSAACGPQFHSKEIPQL